MPLDSTTTRFAEWRKSTGTHPLFDAALTQPLLVPDGYIDAFERAHRDMFPWQVAEALMADLAARNSSLWKNLICRQIEEAVRRSRAEDQP